MEKNENFFPFFTSRICDRHAFFLLETIYTHTISIHPFNQPTERTNIHCQSRKKRGGWVRNVHLAYCKNILCKNILAMMMIIVVDDDGKETITKIICVSILFYYFVWLVRDSESFFLMRSIQIFFFHPFFGCFFVQILFCK